MLRSMNAYKVIDRLQEIGKTVIITIVVCPIKSVFDAIKFKTSIYYCHGCHSQDTDTVGLYGCVL